MNFKDKLSKLLDLFEEIKQELKVTNKDFYERWKAGGFAVTDEFFSMYPNLQKFYSEEYGEQ